MADAPGTGNLKGVSVMSRHRRATLIRTPALVLLPFLLLACAETSPTGPDDSVEEIDELPRSLSPAEEGIIDAGNDFAFRFLDQVYGAAPDSNVFLSPLSASMALGMTANGAAGATFQEMRTTLGFEGLSLEEINQAYRDLMDLLGSLDPRVEMAIGNSIWYREGFSVRADFLDRTRTYFDAEVAALDFGDPGAAEIINAWVSDATKGKIEEIVDPPIDPLTVMFLINAIYFKGTWTFQFDQGKTAQAPFHARDGTTSPVPLMELTGSLPYTATDDYQIVDLPYGGKAFSMTVVLPREGRSLEDLVASLDPATWNAMLAGLSSQPGTVQLPRFRMEWEKLLNETLKAMGMELPFLPGQADFSGMSDDAPGLHIKKVKQKAYVDVNEEGTEAAAVTSVEMGLTSANSPFTFRADRPFLFVLRERLSGTLLFAGIYLEPPEA